MNQAPDLESRQRPYVVPIQGVHRFRGQKVDARLTQESCAKHQLLPGFGRAIFFL
jgi:hypothetical protein